ncbi:MAG: glycoside hydrolase family 3 N-terminal domain-containing protein, partial [Spirochaetaceae bacterium]
LLLAIFGAPVYNGAVSPLFKAAGVTAVFALLLLSSCATTPPEPRTRTAPPEPRLSPGGDWALAPVTEELEARVDELMEEMSLDELLGQRFMSFVPRGLEFPTADTRPGTRAGGSGDPIEALFAPVPPAGFILYSWNLPGYKETALLTKELQRMAAERAGAGPKLLFAVDQEGGRVANLRFSEIADFPSAFQQALRGDVRYVGSGAYVTATDLRRAGIRMNFAPVLDVYPREDRTIIGDRSFGGEPQLVAELGSAYIESAMEAGVAPVAKHFPGHGVSTVDSHGALPISDRTLNELRERDLVPFRVAVEAGVPAIMTAHILYEEVDPEYPATLSPRFIHELLREELGFEGVVVTDGFSMGALTREYSRVEALRQSFLAGVDLILLHARYEYRELFGEAVELLRAGVIDEELIREGARRVLLLKARLGLL